MEEWEQPPIDWASLKRIGIDEFVNEKRHQYYLIITDLVAKKPIAVLPNRTKLELKCFLAQIR